MRRDLFLQILAVFVFTVPAGFGLNNRSAVSLAGSDMATCTVPDPCRTFDVAISKTNNGGEVVNMRVATSEQWKDRDGNRQERTEWHNVVIFNENLGRVAKSYLRKGSKVYLEGQIQAIAVVRRPAQLCPSIMPKI